MYRDDELLHYGIKGQKWGIQRYQKEDRSLTNVSLTRKHAKDIYKNATINNLEKWGNDADHNILYITGISGSGKSTIARDYANNNKNTSVIHLDGYFEMHNLKDASKWRNKEFNNFLDSNRFDYSQLNNRSLFNSDKTKYFKYVDEFSRLSEEYGKEQFKNNNKVIAEGVQINDETLYPDKSFFDDKPIIITNTDEQISKQRAKERDVVHSIGDVEMRNDELMHIGMPRRSGRYPWGSGKESYQRTGDFLARIDDLKKQGISSTDIAKTLGLSSTRYRTQYSLAKDERRLDLYDRAKGLQAKGYSLNQIAKEMGYNNDSSVRSILNESSSQRMNEAKNVAALLKTHVDEKGMIDIGVGVERELGITKEKLRQAVYILELEGYSSYGGRAPQVVNAGQNTTLKVLCSPGTEHSEIYDFSKIHTIHDYDTMTGKCSVDPVFKYPKSIDGKRIKIRYAEEGGITKDGTIEIKRGVEDLNLGNSHYSQVRILVDKDRYLKGMAVYKDDDNFPPGIDIVFNSNKSKDIPPRDVFKTISLEDPSNPFGSKIKEDGGQSHYINSKTGKRELSAINKRADEGDWNDWSKGLPSQFLAKQPKALIKKQLDLSKADKLAEYEEIMSIDNPTVRRNLLKTFSDDCDSSAVHLKAAALPRQRYQVILPIDSLKDKEVYAPNFEDGETVALVRFPHGGTFEIPILKVNNKNKDAIKMISKNPKDAVCVNSKVAERLSGADFDGDTVLTIPTGTKNKILSTPPLDGLKDFNNKKEYPSRPGMRVMTKSNLGIEMGVISNLITDITLKGANSDEIAMAVKHSMVVIDSHKHHLDYKKSEVDNQIAALKKRYQSNIDANGKERTGGASTLLSRSKSQYHVEKRVGSPRINLKGKPYYDPTKPEGALLYNRVVNKKDTPDYDPTKPEGVYVNRKPQTYIDDKGKTQTRMLKSTKMMEAEDATKLISSMRTPQEELYADYANYLKSLANTSRKSLATTGRLESNPQAKKDYRPEVASLTAQLNTALKNAPRERQAQLIAGSIVKAKQAANPDIDSDHLKKMKQQEITAARHKVGAERVPIVISDREWEAIQKGAITDNILIKILQNTDIDSLRERATPKSKTKLTPAKINRLNAMKASGYTNEEIAKALGVSSSLIIKYL